ncbi:RraA family protein [Pedobacter sp. PAMC26386]|nr:RraA family protein [Pedobacter sp. PAMC26386]
MEWNNDEELFKIIRNELYTAVIGDVMDKNGFLNQFLSPQIHALRNDMFIVGRAMTVLSTDILDGAVNQNEVLAKPFGLMLEALDDLKKDEVYVCSGASPRYALWGELMSTRAIKLGAAGAVVNGYSRDTNGILEMGFPTFSLGRYAQDQAPRGKVIDFRVPIEMCGVRINSGDIIIADIDGVCVVPRSAEKGIFSLALEKARGEKVVQGEIQEGMSATDAFRKYGIL